MYGFSRGEIDRISTYIQQIANLDLYPTKQMREMQIIERQFKCKTFYQAKL